ncbi:hypothetical protein M378DRAFT_154804 [Amanita muscaria Koide BX008]|uniref:Uncharacterized protein n=1 Tax=Amanita muscaria (strain Koide BX008) TaxID=946122 RepID=A0A0C2XNU0_AMAMK|nr:hypothetical protein M378DRAFT_154804 [Amanita muscaria Koide BX008]
MRSCCSRSAITSRDHETDWFGGFFMDALKRSAFRYIAYSYMITSLHGCILQEIMKNIYTIFFVFKMPQSVVH